MGKSILPIRIPDLQQKAADKVCWSAALISILTTVYYFGEQVIPSHFLPLCFGSI